MKKILIAGMSLVLLLSGCGPRQEVENKPEQE